MKLRIDVKKTHIKNGQKSSGGCCPIALAVKSAIKTKNRVHVGYIRIQAVDKNAKTFNAWLPLKAKKFISRFDRGYCPKSSFKPFSFNLDVRYEEKD